MQEKQMLNISKQIYSSVNVNRIRYPLPEAEIIPAGETVQEKKKIDKLAKAGNQIAEYENTPLPGFTLFKNDRKNYGSEPTWLVIDPRGFLTRITSENLTDILSYTGITEGLIQEKCIWARENSKTKMELVPISSPLYIEAQKNTELLEGKVDIKTVQIGDTVLLQNGLQGKYLGTMSLYAPVVEKNFVPDYIAQKFLRRQVVEITNSRFFYQSDVKILKVVDRATTTMTADDGIEYVNRVIQSGPTFFTSNVKDVASGRYYSTYGMIKFVSHDAVKTANIELEEVDNLAATALFFDALAENDIGMLLLESHAGKKYIIDFPSRASATQPSIQFMHVSEVEDIVEDRIRLKSLRKSYNQVNTKGYSLDYFAKYYKIKKTVKNNYYV